MSKPCPSLPGVGASPEGTAIGRETFGSGLPHALEAALAALALLGLLPALALLALAVALDSRGPVLFRSPRIGRHGRRFELLKLRTMHVGRDGPELTAGGDARVTRLGRWLRRWKLDELPQLVNVIRGELAIVGPRPGLPRHYRSDDPLWRRLATARPGITDPVTVRLRNEEDLLAQVAGDLDLWYVAVLQPYKLRGYLEYLERRTWWSDLGVIAETLLAVASPGRRPPPTLAEVEADALRERRAS